MLISSQTEARVPCNHNANRGLNSQRLHPYESRHHEANPVMLDERNANLMILGRTRSQKKRRHASRFQAISVNTLQQHPAVQTRTERVDFTKRGN